MRYLLLLLTLLLSVNAYATDEEISLNLTKIQLTESAEKEVEQDRVKAMLLLQKDGNFAEEIQSDINKQMQKAVAEVKKEPKINLSTGRYSVNPRWDSELRKNVGFRAEQQLILDASDKESLLKMVGKLQAQGFMVESLQPYLSSQKQASYRTELIQKALEMVKDRAAEIAKTLGKSQVHIAEISVDTPYVQRPTPVFMAKTMALESAAVAPVAEAADQLVRVSVSVSVVLKD